MPLLRTHWYSLGTQIYCVPTVDARESFGVTMQHIATEGRVFVLSACQFAQTKVYLFDFEILSKLPIRFVTGLSAQRYVVARSRGDSHRWWINHRLAVGCRARWTVAQNGRNPHRRSRLGRHRSWKVRSRHGRALRSRRVSFLAPFLRRNES